MSRIKVLVVDDSAVVRQVVAGLLADDPGIEVIGAVADPILAIARMKVQWPDVFVLDIEMPRMDGITFLKRIMAERPTPVVICSTLTEKGAQTSLAALSAGAVAIITKPKNRPETVFGRRVRRFDHRRQGRRPRQRKKAASGGKAKR